MVRARVISVSLLLAAFLVVGCRRTDPNAAPSGPQLQLFLECPGDALPTVKASEGEVPSANADEYALHSLRVWVFNSETHARVTSLTLTEAQFPSAGRVRRYMVPVSREFARTRPDVDVFALANAASVGCTLGEDASWEDLNEALFGDDWFGVQSPVRTVNPSLGLPMSGVGKDLPIQGEEPVLKIETIRLTRAVSKVRYVFCRMKEDGDDDDVSVDNITLNGGLIASREYLFTTSACAILPGNYEDLPLTVPGSANIAKNASPEKLVYAGQDPVSYENLLNSAVSEGILTDCGVIYLRETNKALTGHVDYTINGEAQSPKSFTMDAPGDFARNHSWTLYGYFLGGRNLQMSVRVLPWDYTVWGINFSDESVQASQLFIDDTTVSMREVSGGHFDVRLLAGVTAKLHLFIHAPVSGKLMIRPVGDAGSFLVSPDMADINPSVDGGRIDIDIRRNPAAEGDLTGHYITLSFSVELGEREIDANTEILNNDVYRFIL